MLKRAYHHSLKRPLAAILLLLLALATPLAPVMADEATIADPASISAESTTTASTEQLQSFKIIADVRQGEARKLLDKVNAARKAVGVAPLTWDSALEQTAMQRAAELTVHFDHTRPNGLLCFTAWPASLGAGENIAYGYSDATAVNKGWTNSPGHYSNMIKDSFTSFAAGCCANANGGLCWVECFASGDGTGIQGTAVSGERVFTVEVDPSVLEGGTYLAFESPTYGSTVDLPKGATQSMRGWVRLNNTATLDSSSLTWQSSNTAVATVTSDGIVQAQSAGTATITASTAGLSGSLKVRVSQNLKDATVDPIPDAAFTGKAVKPAVVVRFGTTTLVQGTDYTVSYKKNTKIGTATVTIKGKGNFTGSRTAKFRIVKAANPLVVKAAKKTVKLAKVKKKAQTIAPIKASKAQGAVSYKVSKWTTPKAKKYFSISKKTGKVTVKRGTPKGTYKFKVKVTAKGNANYKSGSQTVAVTVVVK